MHAPETRRGHDLWVPRPVLRRGPNDPVGADEEDHTAPGPRTLGAERRAVAALGTVTATLPGGEQRSQQAEMCAAVARSMDLGRHLIVQAGTGTGKSLAYLVPAVLSGQKVVVATATKALQDQLAGKDLPQVAAALGRPVAVAVLKGRSNYLCRQRASELWDRGVQPELGEPGSFGDESAGPDGAGASAGEADPTSLVEQVQALVHWGQRSGRGDRADLPFEPSARAWSMVSVGPRECPGAFRCPSGGDCFAEAARAEAAAADVVVVNTHLYGAHLASGGAVLPEHDLVVFDEAHELEAVMTASLGVEISPARLRALVALARPALDGEEGTAALGELAQVAERLQGELAARTGTRVGVPAGRHRGQVGRRPDADPDPEPVGEDPLAVLPALAEQRVARLVELLRRGEQGSMFAEGPDTEGPRGRALVAATHLVEDLRRYAERDVDQVAWVDGSVRNPVLRLSPVDVGPLLAGSLWAQVSAVLTSATIPVRLAERLGLDGRPFDQLDVGSPFDYRANALLYVARHLPDRRHPESEAALHDELAWLIEAAGGRTLALFTSWRATRAAVEALTPRLDVPVLAQGELPKPRLLAAFSEEETSCLFATLGFWQGVDVPGRSLSMVTLDRLPFARPDDPLFEARRERAGEDAFATVDLPRAATLLAQGAGRLVRSTDDFGVVAVLDPRLATAGYRRVLLSALPPMRRSTERREVAAFFAEKLAQVPGRGAQ